MEHNDRHDDQIKFPKGTTGTSEQRRNTWPRIKGEKRKTR